MRLLVIAALFSAVHALPSCDAETDANCVGEDADLSPEGINACLAALAEKSDETPSSSYSVKDASAPSKMRTWTGIHTYECRCREGRVGAVEDAHLDTHMYMH